MIKTKGSLFITTPSYGDGREKISISVTDSKSRVGFLELEIDYNEFTKALVGGREGQDCDISLRGLGYIGKTRRREMIEVPMPPHEYKDRDEVAYKVCHDLLKSTDNRDWHLSKYFGSKDSFFVKDGVHYCKTQVDYYEDE